jgi:hypothetical protein
MDWDKMRCCALPDAHVRPRAVTSVTTNPLTTGQREANADKRPSCLEHAIFGAPHRDKYRDGIL